MNSNERKHSKEAFVDYPNLSYSYDVLGKIKLTLPYLTKKDSKNNNFTNFL